MWTDIYQPHSYRGKWVVFEGSEGAGKSTQIQYLKKRLEDSGRTVMLVREPGTGAFGEAVRSLVLNPPEPVTAAAELYLFLASRSQLLEQTVLPALKDAKTVVLMDRFIMSSLAYQGHGRELGAQFVLQAHKNAPLNLGPDLTVVLDLDRQQAKKRVSDRGGPTDQIESRDEKYFQRVYEGLIESARALPRAHILDASPSAETISDQVWDLVQKAIK